MSDRIKEKDVKVLSYQLGRKPRNLIKIVKRCDSGYPQVSVSYPLLEGDSQLGLFPTIFWLSCPELNYMIDRLEEMSFIQKAQEEIAKDKELADQLRIAHQNYADYRIELIATDKLHEIKDNYSGQYNVLKNSGVGGIQDSKGVKCLHTHYAHYIATSNNPIGKLVDKWLVEEFDCHNRLKICNVCEEAKNEESSN